MRLTPADFEILGVLRDGRNLATNIAAEIDKSRKYINRRMGYLLDYELVTKVGPVEDTGLYEITDRGRLAYEHRERYHDEDIDFDDFLDELADQS
ncbi:phage repressor protein [Halomicroarcula sp. GCM10025709]|uniref:phage repressor protein n=1 Tax=Haloarcula TaxID=2237 RepID=UPI0024C37C60|nr:phage repressor protein [Halomicroarcula sp. YJ-61-S]